MNLLRKIQSHLGLTETRPVQRAADFLADPDAPLVVLNGYGDALRVRDFYEGVQIVGGTGSGKSSGSGMACARAMLQAGWGGIVLCAKPDEAERWIGYLRDCGRLNDLVLMRPGSGLNFNFIEYEFRRPDGHGADVFNIVTLIMVVVEGMRVALGQPAQDADGAFWIAAVRELLTNLIEPLIAATGRFRLDDLMRFIAAAPATRDEAYSEAWKERSYCYWVLQQAYLAPQGPALPEHALRAATDYWFSTYAGLDTKTRSNIVATLTAAISPFLRGVLHDTFCTNTTIIPEMAHEGAVIVVDYPIKTMGPAAVVAGQIMKYQWQRATERRAVGPQTRPTFGFADECQFFLSRYDAEFQSTARSSRAATIYLTQNLPTYYALLPGRDPKASADSLLGNFQTKIFHANTDATTNQYASELIGKSLQRRASGSWSVNDGWSNGTNESRGTSFQRGDSSGRNWGGSSNSSVTYSDDGKASYTVGGGSSGGGQKGKSRSWSRSRNSGSSQGISGGRTEGGGWSEQMDYTVPPAAFAARLRKGGQSDNWLVDAVVIQGGRRFAVSNAHWLPCTFHQ
jgi:hypothetical protein